MDAKQRAGARSVEFIEDGMTVGLGTGSTAYWMVERLGERVREGLSVRCVPTSRRSTRNDPASEHKVASWMAGEDTRKLELSHETEREVERIQAKEEAQHALQRPRCWRQRLGIRVWDFLNSVGRSTAGPRPQPLRRGISI